MTGVIVLDKPTDFTSFDAVAVVRKLTREKKIGHTGTLDPMATGVLPLLLGRGTKAASLLPDTSKSYEAGFEFGKSTTTEDSTGELVQSDENKISYANLISVLPSFTGDIFQIPPMYSAVSVNGQRLYTLARMGIEIEREKRPVSIASIEIVSYNEIARTGIMRISCSKGTYIRTLINDMGKALGSVGGIMTSLRRTFACGFDISEAVTLDELRVLAEKGEIESVLRPVEKLFEGYIRAEVTEPQEKRFLNGGELDLERLKMPKIVLTQDMPIMVFGSEFLGLGKVDIQSGQLKILKLLK